MPSRPASTPKPNSSAAKPPPPSRNSPANITAASAPPPPSSACSSITLIDCEWLLRRFRAIETQLWERVVDIYDITLGHIFSEHTGEFTRLQRRIDSTQRHYHNALNQLRRLQAEEPAPDPEHDPTPRNQPVSAPNGFVPQAGPQTLPPPTTQIGRAHV